MTADEALAIHQRVQQAYAVQLAELSGDQPDLERCGRLAADIEAELAALPSPAAFTAYDGDTRKALAAAARQSMELLECSRAALLAQRARMLGIQSRAELSDGALRAYLPVLPAADARFLDERH
jgi:hypothetical protein